MDNRCTILYVDDEVSNLHIFKDTFRREYIVLTALSAKEGLDILQREKVDLVLSDHRMPVMDGVSFLKEVLQNYPDLNRLLVTGYTDFEALRNAINEAEIFQYIQKPWKEDHLRSIIERALEIYHLKIENDQLSKQLQEKNDLLEKINNDLVDFEKQKYDYLSTISHEIRTPLNGLVGSIELIKSGLSINDPNTIEVIYIILETSIRKLEQFLLSAEHITFLKAHRYPLNIEKNDLKEEILRVQTILEDKIAEKNLNIITDLKESTSLCADKELLKITLKVIIDNAVKYSPKNGKIFINSSLSDEWFILEVIDQGEGFSSKTLKNAFQLFNKGDKKNEENYGLDLNIVKMIMDEHSGKIILQNAVNSGACIQLFFKPK